MLGLPKIIDDLLPTPPWKGPPIPNFLTKNPGTWKAWTAPEEYRKVAEKAGDWATARSASMLSKADVMAGKLDEMSEKMYGRMMTRLSMIPAPPTVAPPKVKKPPVKKVPKVEVAPPVTLKRAKTADIEELIRAASDWRRERGRFPDLTLEVESIANEKGFTISDTQAKRIQRALNAEKPITLEEIKLGVVEWAKSAKAPGELPSVSEIEDYVRFEYLGYRLTDEVANKWLEEIKKGG